MIYTTVSGDLWDMISYNVYGSEEYMGLLMQANPKYIDTVVFKSGIEINAPDLDESDTELPPWRSEADNESSYDDEFDDMEDDE